ncbi:MAG: hypothetical protein AAF439_07685 [Pseudomonadota bacterium]
MRWLIACLVALSPPIASAEEQLLTGNEISELMPRIEFVRQRGVRVFSPDGSSHVVLRNGRRDATTWRVEKELFCLTSPILQDEHCYSIRPVYRNDTDRLQAIILISDEREIHQTVNLK